MQVPNEEQLGVIGPVTPVENYKNVTPHHLFSTFRYQIIEMDLYADPQLSLDFWWFCSF